MFRFTRSSILALAVWAPLAAVGPPSAHAELASWYKMGHRTASGMAFGAHISATNPYLAAHKGLPFGTRLLITNLKNGRTQCVSIQDRGPYVRGVSYDLTLAAARSLGFVDEGHAHVRAQQSNCYIPAGYLPQPQLPLPRHHRHHKLRR